MFGQAFAITGINIRSIPERWTSSLVIVIGLAGVVAVFCALLAMATGFSSTLKATGREENRFCMACFNGKYPIEVKPHIDKLILERRRERADSLVFAEEVSPRLFNGKI